jgi:hypothetical protein
MRDFTAISGMVGLMVAGAIFCLTSEMINGETRLTLVVDFVSTAATKETRSLIRDQQFTSLGVWIRSIWVARKDARPKIDHYFSRIKRCNGGCRV